MKTINLSEQLKKFTSGWVVFDKDYHIKAHAEEYDEVVKLAKKIKGGLIVPATKDYFGYIT